MDHIILVQFFLLVPIKSQLFFSKKIDKKQGSRGNSNFTAKEIDKLISLSMGKDSGEFSKKKLIKNKGRVAIVILPPKKLIS